MSAATAGAVFAVMTGAGLIRVTRVGMEVDGAGALAALGAGSLVVMLLVDVAIAWWEELVFRGYLLQNMIDGMGLAWAVGISCVVNGLAHAGNPSAGVLSTTIIALFGLLGIYAYLVTGRLWLPIGLHAGWNFFQGPVLGYAASGHTSPSLIGHETVGPSWGRDPGPSIPEACRSPCGALVHSASQAEGGPVVAVLAFAVVALASSTAAPGCTCAIGIERGGWCEVHESGAIGGVEVPFRTLYETLDAHGHEVDHGTFECAVCRDAIDSDGFCPEHRIGFVGGLAYFSRLTFELARGTRVDAASVECGTCRRHMLDRGWCDACARGHVGATRIAERDAYDAMDRALDIVEAAVITAERCESCAVAQLTDTTCPVCGFRYLDGAVVGRVPPRTSVATPD